MKAYQVHDRDRVLAFRGVLLGEATSQRPGRDRWFEVRIFRTEAGTYVIEGVGRSSLPREVDISWVKLVDTAADAVKALYRIDDNGILRLTSVAQRALDQAAERAPEFAVTLVA